MSTSSAIDASPASTHLAGAEVIGLTGPDALAFAQAQMMSDVAALGDGDWQWSGWLTPKGRLVAFFALYRRDAQSLIAWLPAGGAEALRERWQRYVFRSKVKIEVRGDWVAIGETDVAAPAGDAIARIEIDGGDAPSRRVVLAASDSPLLAGVAHDTAALNAWRLRDLRLGVPYIAAGAANSEQFVPQWLSLERLGAYGLKKGCYPGQEIVARMHYLGQSKRAAFRLIGDGAAPPPMARVFDAGGAALGDVVWSEADGGGWQALAVLAVDKADAVAAVEGGGGACETLG